MRIRMRKCMYKRLFEIECCASTMIMVRRNMPAAARAPGPRALSLPTLAMSHLSNQYTSPPTTLTP